MNDTNLLQMQTLKDERHPTKHICNVSGGVASWYAARLVKDRFMDEENGDEIHLVFCDTKVEDEGTYDFVRQTADDIGVDLVVLSDGRSIWEIFRDRKIIGNKRIDPCSKHLKRDLMDRWRKENCEVQTSVHYYGMEWMEINRWTRHMERIAPWKAVAPLLYFGYDKNMALSEAKKRGMKLPPAYDLGFSHSNCAGMCVKAGVSHWTRLYHLRRDRFDEAMNQEEKLMAQLGRGRKVAILTYERSGRTYPLPLRELAEQIEAKNDMFQDMTSDGGCGCALES